QLVQLFLNEGLDIVLDADRILDHWAANPEETGALEQLRSELGQLTSGAADAGLTDVAALSGALKDTYDAMAANDESPDDDFFGTIRAAHEQLINMMDQVAAGLATESSDELVARLEALQTTGTEKTAEANAFDQEFTDDLEEIDLSFDMEDIEAPAAEKSPSEEQPPLPEMSESDDDMDAELAEIFLEEARDLIDSTAEALQSWSENTGNLDILRLLQRDLHTLKGGARLADIPAVGDLSHELENLFEGLTEQRLSVNDELSDLLFRCHDRLAGMVENLEASEAPRPAPDLIGEIQAYMDNSTGTRPVTNVRGQDNDTDQADQTPVQEPEAPEPTAVDEPHREAPDEEEPAASDGIADLSHLDPELVGIFLEEAYDLINSTGSALHTWTEDPSDRAVAAELQRDVHTLKGGARMAGVEAIGDLTHVLEDLFEKVAEGQLEASDSMNDLLFACHDRLAQMVEQVATQKPCPPADELVARVQSILRGEALPAAAPEEEAEQPEEAGPAQPPADEAPESTSLSDTLAQASDDDLIGIFLDEGLEIRDAISECLDQWREEPDELTGVTQLQQELHTLKGGARLSDVDPIADLAEAWSDALDPLI
ncbi:MAG: Hpt domain-containing protein, partial [Marinobacter sp.]|nr:Hpt domain-containing protein [Marinobacter sp.]